jgi:hypothetical protein
MSTNLSPKLWQTGSSAADISRTASGSRTCPSKNGRIGQLSSGADQDPARRPAPSKCLPNRIDKPIRLRGSPPCCALEFQAGGVVLFVGWRVGAERRGESGSSSGWRRRYCFRSMAAIAAVLRSGISGWRGRALCRLAGGSRAARRIRLELWVAPAILR